MKTSRFMIRTLITIFLTWFFVMLLTLHAYAEDCIITYYGQGVFSVEHNGVIHIQGRGEPEKEVSENDTDSSFYYNNQSVISTEDYLEEYAQKKESMEDFYIAAIYYKEAGNIEKMKEMAYKDIDKELAKNPPDYNDIITTAIDILKDKDLAMEYYEKYLDQQFNLGGTEQ